MYKYGRKRAGGCSDTQANPKSVGFALIKQKAIVALESINKHPSWGN